MFSSTPRSDTPAGAPPIPAARPSNGSHTPQTGGVLSSGVSIKGSIKFNDELHIDGEVEGSIDSRGRLTVGKNAHIRGEIRTRAVTVYGIVDGNVTAEERCELHSGCTLRGDIEAPRLVVDEDATFLGSAKIATTKRPAA
jgi:cytoskeletal protein CcmA (bactofilin family)